MTLLYSEWVFMKSSMKNKDQIQALNLLANEFELEIEASFEKLLKFIEAEVDHLLVNNFEKLLWICYRVDVPENVIMQLLDDVTVPEPANAIATKLLERQIQKIETKRKYNQTPDDNVDEDLKW